MQVFYVPLAYIEGVRSIVYLVFFFQSIGSHVLLKLILGRKVMVDVHWAVGQPSSVQTSFFLAKVEWRRRNEVHVLRIYRYSTAACQSHSRLA